MPDKKVSQLDELASSSVDTINDILHIVDTSATSSKKVTVESLLKSVNNLTSIASATVDPQTDLALLYDSSANTVHKVTVQDLVETLNTSANTYSSGWEAITTGNDWSHNGNAASKKFTHNLGTTNLQISVYAAEDSNGGNAVLVSPAYIFPQQMKSSKRYGCQAQFVTTANVTIQLGQDGYTIWNRDGGTETILNWTYMKVVCRK
jgi:hypothetical protein